MLFLTSMILTITILFTSANVQADVIRYTQKPSEDELYTEEVHSDYPFDIFNDEKDRTNIYTISRIAIKEFDFLTGLNEAFINIEKKIDKLATTFGLKGDVSLNPNKNSLDVQISKKPPSQTLSIKSIFLPDRIKWNVGYDPDAQVSFGEINWGKYISIQSEIGDQSKVKLLFTYNF